MAQIGPKPLSTRGETQLAARVAASHYRVGYLIEKRYELLRPLGAGGAGVVWVAADVVQGNEVALKVLDSQDPDSARRMGLEAQAAAQLNHPAVVRVFHFGSTERGDPYLAMELLDGESLAELIGRRQRLEATEAVQLLLPVVDGLHAAHLAGILHRDLKPDNILVARDGQQRPTPKLLDFGSARLIRSGPSLTDAHQAIGTPPYMSPEQVTARHAIDHRTDIWALCVVLYRIVAGRRPFTAGDHRALVFAIAHEEPPSLSELGVADAALWALVERGMRKSPRQRYQTMFELGRALASWLAAQGIEEDCAGSPLATTWLEPRGARLEFASAIPSKPPAVGVDEIEAPHRLRYTAFAPKEQRARPVVVQAESRSAPKQSGPRVQSPSLVARLTHSARSPRGQLVWAATALGTALVVWLLNWLW